MAISPCMLCGQRYKGSQLNVYAQSFEGDMSQRYRMVVCPGCRDGILEPFVRVGLYRNADGEWEDCDGEPRYSLSEPLPRASSIKNGSMHVLREKPSETRPSPTTQ